MVSICRVQPPYRRMQDAACLPFGIDTRLTAYGFYVHKGSLLKNWGGSFFLKMHALVYGVNCTYMIRASFRGFLPNPDDATHQWNRLTMWRRMRATLISSPLLCCYKFLSVLHDCCRRRRCRCCCRCACVVGRGPACPNTACPHYPHDSYTRVSTIPAELH